MFRQRLIAMAMERLHDGVPLEAVRIVVDLVLEECAALARQAPGQDWSDGTTPGEMAEFIADMIEGKG